jgi:hypothetical protein
VLYCIFFEDTTLLRQLEPQGLVMYFYPPSGSGPISGLALPPVPQVFTAKGNFT